MRIWSLHPKYLDKKGLLALWREGLGVQSIIKNGKKGYRNHPQVMRFLQQKKPLEAIADYLEYVYRESESRGYRFNRELIDRSAGDSKIKVAEGQLTHEFELLIRKLALPNRDPVLSDKLSKISKPETHPSMLKIPGDIAVLERKQIGHGKE